MILKRIKQKVGGLVRHTATTPIRLLPARARANAIERLSEEMIADVETPRGPIRLFCPSTLLAYRAETLLSKEPDMIRWIDGFTENSVFWDVGANAGIFALYAGMRAGITVVAFEPSAANYHVLSRNIQLNGLQERVRGYCIALSSKTELGVLNMPSAAMGASMSHFGQSGEMSRYAGEKAADLEQGMVGFTVDDFMERLQPPFPNYLKMDVDGLELPILEGAVKTLRDSRLRAAMVELSLTDVEEADRAFAVMEHAGLQLASRGDRQTGGTESAANHLFERVRSGS